MFESPLRRIESSCSWFKASIAPSPLPFPPFPTIFIYLYIPIPSLSPPDPPLLRRLVSTSQHGLGRPTLSYLDNFSIIATPSLCPAFLHAHTTTAQKATQGLNRQRKVK